MDRYAVVGNPVAHSKSPEIHAQFAAQTGQALAYERLLAPLEGFADAVARFRAGGGHGLNVTVPFKEQAWRIADRRSDRAQRAGAVNTLVFGAEGTFGDNTDGAGLVRDITVNHGIGLHGRRMLVLGAGGAVRGILPNLLAERPERAVIANRTVARALQLARDFRDLGPLAATGFEALEGQCFDVVLNATSAGLTGETPPLPDSLLAPQALCYDLLYADRLTPFLRWAQDNGAAQALDGLGMLVEQAAESFHLWRGVRPDTGPVIRSLRG